MTTLIHNRVESLRSFLKEQNLQAFIFPSTDPHQGEYIPDHWKTRTWISGFDGSAGTAVVTLKQAALWTDSRYFLAAEEQLDGTPFQLMKERIEGTPSIPEWLGRTLPSGSRVGIDPEANAFATFQDWKAQFETYGIELVLAPDPAQRLWLNRPPIPENPVSLHPIEFSGEETASKLTRIRQILHQNKAEAILVSVLDEIAWILNLRGTDIHCNPVFISYLLITDTKCTLFIYSTKISQEVSEYLKNNHIQTREYNQVTDVLHQSTFSSIMLDLANTNCALVDALPATCHIINRVSPAAIMKAVKNDTEIQGFHQAMLRDGVAMVQFLKWLQEEHTKQQITELSLSNRLEEFRAQQKLYRDISFDTIAAYGAHGAIVHYEPTQESDIPLENKGMLLLDSGAQYQDGTTDLTRTIALGPLSEEEKRDYTLVLKGHIALSRAVFPEGTTGTQLDICARYAMWQEGVNYLHGTGHGVGSYLNVHEGPHQIRMNFMPAPLCAGMTVTDEPGIYKAGRHGVRIENTLLIVPFKETEFGKFLRFEPLTLCPIDTTPILVSLLDQTEINWINSYHQTVYQQLAPLLDEEHRYWLKQQTSPLIIKENGNH